MEIAGYGLQEELPYIGLTLWNILLFIIVLVVGFILVKIVSKSLKKNLLKTDMTEILAEFLTRVLRIFLYIFLITISLSFLGLDIGAALVSLSVMLGFVLGFALKDTLGSIAAGVMLAVTTPFKVGDNVEVNGEEGIILHVGISLTEMDTRDNKHVVIPNKHVWDGTIINYTHNKYRRADIETEVSYDDDLDLAIETSLKTIKKHSKVVDDPEPTVKIKAVDDSAIVLTVRPWVRSEDYWGTYLDLQKELKEAYDEAGLEIPYPQRDVHLDEE